MFPAMRFGGLAALLVLARSTLASTPAGFHPSVPENLPMTYAGGVQVSPPGVSLTESQVASVPTLGKPTSVKAASRYVLVMVDYNVDVNGTQTSVLQWYQPFYKLDRNTKHLVVSNPSATNAPYISPEPNVGPAHKYVAVLYNQPAGYSFPSCLNMQLQVRGGLDLQKFTSDAGLGSPVAANWFKVKNPTPATTTYKITSTSVLSYSCNPT